MEACIDKGSGQSARGESAGRRLSLDYFLPGLSRLRAYDVGKGRADAIAGAVVAVLLVPQAVAYAQLAELPASAGLYASMLPLLVYAFCGARANISIGPVALVSLLVADAVANGGGDLEPTASSALLTLMVGLALAVAGVARLGFLVRFVSNPVIKGFTAAAAVLIALSQLGSMLGIELERGALPATVTSLLEKVDAVHVPTVLVSAAALAGFLLGGRPWERLVHRLLGEGGVSLVLIKAAPLAVIVLAIVGSALADGAARHGIEMVGALDSGLPSLTLPPLDVAAATAMLPSALAIAAIVFVVATGIADSLDAGGERTTPDRESIALGAANAASALSGGYAVGASFSRSALVANAGAATAFTLGVTAVLVLLVVLFAGDAFAWLPRGVLGALIVSAVWSLIDLRAMRRVWRFSRAEAATLFLTTAAVLFGGLQIGIATGALAGIALYLHGTSRPRVTLEGRLEGESSLRGAERDDVASSGGGRAIVVRVDESLYFANASHVRRCIVDALGERPDARVVLLDLKSVDTVDYTALETLEGLVDALDGRDVSLRLIGTKRPVWKTLERFGLVERCGGAERHFETEDEALAWLDEAADDGDGASDGGGGRDS